MRLEPSVLAELSRRTEGWAASLQLVRAALARSRPRPGALVHLVSERRRRSPLRVPRGRGHRRAAGRSPALPHAHIRPRDRRPCFGPVAAGTTIEETSRLIEAGERHGLFGKGGRTRHVVRAHPLVRDFLQARLASTVGVAGIREINLHIARHAEPANWRISAQHYVASGHVQDAKRVLSGAIDRIVGSGAIAFAGDLSAAIPGGLGGSADLVLRSRIALQRASADEGLRLAEDALEADPDSLHKSAQPCGRAKSRRRHLGGS